MVNFQEQLIKDAIKMIRLGDIDGIRGFYDTVTELIEKSMDLEYVKLDPGYIYKRLITVACQYRMREIILFMLEIYKDFDYLEKSALKPTFKYCKAKMPSEDKAWFTERLTEIKVYY